MQRQRTITPVRFDRSAGDEVGDPADECLILTMRRIDSVGSQYLVFRTGVNEAMETGRFDTNLVQIALQRLRQLRNRCPEYRHQAALDGIVGVVHFGKACSRVLQTRRDVKRLEVNALALLIRRRVGQAVERAPMFEYTIRRT